MNTDRVGEAAIETPQAGGHVAAERDRRERWWAWASLLVLIVAWDAADRLDRHVPLPRLRLAHAAEYDGRSLQRIDSADL